MRGSPRSSAADPRRVSLVVLDFDGTLTDADAHAPAFYEASRQELASRLGWDAARLGPEWERARRAVEALPSRAAWVVQGYDVCPAVADPYMIANSVCKHLFAEQRAVEDGALVASVLEVHHAAYARVPPPFRPEAARSLEELVASGRAVRVVTNSDGAIVTRLLDVLAFPGRERVVVHGNADKFAVGGTRSPDARFAALPPTAAWPEVGRPVHLRRGRYFDALTAMWRETGADPQTTLVAGDIFELDLAMPAALGARVHLVTRAGTVKHELELVRRLARGGMGASLLDVVARLQACPR